MYIAYVLLNVYFYGRYIKRKMHNYKVFAFHHSLCYATHCCRNTFCDCHELPIERAPERVNVEVTASPECLATATTALGDIDMNIAVAVMPVWRDGTGRMEFGPVGPAKLSQVETKLDAISCIRSIRNGRARHQTPT